MQPLEIAANQYWILAWITGAYWVLGAVVLLACRQWEFRVAGVSCVCAGTMAAVLPVLAALGYV